MHFPGHETFALYLQKTSLPPISSARHSGQPSDSDRRIRPQAPPSDHAADNRSCPDYWVQRPPARSKTQRQTPCPHRQPLPQQHPQQPRLCSCQPRPEPLHPASFRQLPPAPPWASNPSPAVHGPPTHHLQHLYADPPLASHVYACAPSPPKYPGYPRHLNLSPDRTTPQASTPSSCSVPCGAQPRVCMASSPKAALQRKPRFLI